MAVVEITIDDAPSKYSIVGLVPTLQAANVGGGNSNKIAADRDLLLIVFNSGGSSRTITITSQPIAPTNRVGHVTALAIAAGELRLFRLTSQGWADGDGFIQLVASHADIKFAVVNLKKNE